MTLLSKYAEGEMSESLSPRGSRGFSLIELLVVVAVIGIMAAIALPSFFTWSTTLKYRDTALGIAAKSRLARANAVTKNLQTRVELDVNGKQYRVTEGNSPSSSTTWTTVLSPWVAVPAEVEWRTVIGINCTGTAPLNIIFNPNGSSSGGAVCIETAAFAEEYRVIITTASGRVRVN
jgi:type II secretion system protein H